MSCTQAQSGSREFAAECRSGAGTGREWSTRETGDLEAAVAEFRAIAKLLEPADMRAVLQFARALAGGPSVHPAAYGTQAWSRRV